MAKITLPTFAESVNKALSKLAPYYADGKSDRIDRRYVYSDRLKSIKIDCTIFVHCKPRLRLFFQEALYEIEEVYDLDGCLEDILDQWIQDYPQVLETQFMQRLKQKQ